MESTTNTSIEVCGKIYDNKAPHCVICHSNDVLVEMFDNHRTGIMFPTHICSSCAKIISAVYSQSEHARYYQHD